MTRIPKTKRGGIYKRLETDAEYIARLYAAGHRPHEISTGIVLDAFGDAKGMQRRIVESSAD